ncbi:sensor domain-containing diguanylate cyclase [Magnetovibrio sp.]|uniref:sensor domain-containing diguanylate cyclase n=1 Tax=Magnetovibrio sp. TaxID=2024836 RepID=UPI002F95F618
MSVLSLRTKLIALVTLILVAGFVATNVLNYEVSKGALRTTILENELPLSSNNVYSAIQADLLRPIFISSMMANDTFVHEWVLDGEIAPIRMKRYLSQIRTTYNTTTAYFISGKTQRYYHYEGAGQILSESNPDDSWFFAARDMKEPYVVNVDFNYQIDGNITIFINYRVTDENGDFIGVTGVGLGLKSVSDLVKTYQEEFRRNVYFVDDAGLIQVHAEADVVGSRNIHDIDGLDAIAADVLSHDRGSYSYITQDERILLTTRFIPELKWHLFIELPESEALKMMKRGFIRNLLIGPMVILITILLIAYTINIFQRRLEDMAITDKLTGLYNREHFDLSLTQAIKRYKRDGRPFSLLMLDIDHFKPINDELGHLAGDDVIRRTADIIRAQARESDLICRWGGEEFIILASDCTATDAQRLSDAIREALRSARFFPTMPDRTVTGSVGVCEVRPGDDEVVMIGRADQAMYAAKEKGRDRTVIA